MNEEYKRRIFNIPINYSSGLNILGKNYSYRKGAEAFLICSVADLLAFFVCRGVLKLQWETVITVLLGITLLLGYLTLVGINGNTPMQQVQVWLLYRRNRRTLIYNPRIKKEAMPVVLRKNSQESSVPMSKMMQIVNKYRQTYQQKREEQLSGILPDENEKLYFAEDTGIIDKPYEYMSAKERRKKAKEEKADEKKRSTV